jgi:hypothetical protein
MFEWLNNTIVSGMDYVVGWLLRLPSDLALILLAVMTSLAMVLIRKWATDQDFLRRCDADRKQQVKLIKQAKAARDKQAVKRHKDVVTAIKFRATKYELKPLLFSLLPVALLATWGFGRLGFHPPQAGEELTVRAYLPTLAIGTRYPYLDPVDGLEALPTRPGQASPWVQEVVTDTADSKGGGVAIWKIRGQASPRPYLLQMPYEHKLYKRELLIGQPTYSEPVAIAGGDPSVVMEVPLKPRKLFGVVPGFMELLRYMRLPAVWSAVGWSFPQAEFLPPWVMAYLLIAIPLVSLLKRALRIY